jgi:uncharacterized protein YdeI (BOF family)
MKQIIHRILHDRVLRTVAFACLTIIVGLSALLAYLFIPGLKSTTVQPTDSTTNQQSLNEEADTQVSQDPAADGTPGDQDSPANPETTTANTSGNTTNSPSSGQGTAPTPSPSPSPGPSTPACNGQTHVAGGSDGSGGCWPGPDNTGVPDGVVLSAYTGPTTFSSGTTIIDSKLINDDLVVTGSGNLTVKNSRMVGHFDADTASGTLTIIDSEIDGTSWVGATVGFQNVTIVRSNISGSQHSVLCGDNCSVTDSWLHSQHEHNGDHNNAYISNGGSNVVLRHNTLHCTPTGGVGGG